MAKYFQMTRIINCIVMLAVQLISTNSFSFAPVQVRVKQSSLSVIVDTNSLLLHANNSPDWGLLLANNSPDWGLLEGRIGSCLHPAAMISMFGLSVSVGLKGFKWRRQRTIGQEISDLKKTLAPVAEGEVLVPLSSADSATTKQISEFTTERKTLASENNREKHYESGVLLAAIGTFFAIEGPLNTYARAGKLFPGPHLYAGAGLVCLWAAAAACVPQMQKGSETARTLHIGLNAVGTGLFAWQIYTGYPILMKVVELTKFP